MIGLTSEAIDPAAVLAAVRRPDCGGVVLFLGTVRDLTGDQRTVALDYEAYGGMAEKVMGLIEAELRERWPVRGLAMLHRVGHLDIGDVAVAIAVSTPHRSEAFAACHHAIDRVKELVPIWKRENRPDGEATWVHPHDPPPGLL